MQEYDAVKNIMQTLSLFKVSMSHAIHKNIVFLIIFREFFFDSLSKSLIKLPVSSSSGLYRFYFCRFFSRSFGRLKKMY